jgi:hypothetical protein
MVRSIKKLRSYDIAAKDGAIGDVHDVLFDDHVWQARYLVIDTGNWLPGRRVLVSPQAVEQVDAGDETVAVKLTKEEIRGSPGIDADAPVSRQNEIALAEHFRWPRYWEEFPANVGRVPVIPTLRLQPAAAGHATSVEEELLERGDPNLRSATEVTGYHVGARDGDIGHVDDFLIGEEDWRLRYLVVDTRNWLPGRKVLAAPAWTKGIDWAEEKLLVDATKETIEQAPEYEPGMTFGEALERRIFEHYGRKPDRE